MAVLPSSDTASPGLLAVRVPRLWLWLERVTTLYTTSGERLMNSPWTGLILSVPLVIQGFGKAGVPFKKMFICAF